MKEALLDKLDSIKRAFPLALAVMAGEYRAGGKNFSFCLMLVAALVFQMFFVDRSWKEEK